MQSRRCLIPADAFYEWARKVNMTSIIRRKLFLAAAISTVLVIALCFTRHSSTAADDAPAKAAWHASLKAYPNAVISLNDPKTGMLFYVESDGRRLVAFGKDAAVKWSVDVTEEIKAKPLYGSPVIRHLTLDGATLGVTIGKSDDARIEIATGKTDYVGRD